MRIFPIGREAPEGKSYRAGRENYQAIVHGQRSEGLYSPRNNPDSEMIPCPEMIPKLTPKLSRPRNDPHFFSPRPRNDPQLVFEMEWYPRTMDQAKCTTYN